VNIDGGHYFKADATKDLCFVGRLLRMTNRCGVSG